LTFGRRVAAALLGLLVAVIGLGQPATGAIDLATSSVGAYDYGDHCELSMLPTAMSERGPRNVGVWDTTCHAAGRGSHGALAHPGTGPSCAYTDYDHSATFAQVQSTGITTRDQARPADVQLSMRARAGVAAKTVGVLPTPVVESTKLENIVNNLYKGTTNPNRVGNGTTMDAIRNEIATGAPTGGRMHLTKGEESLRGLDNWLAKNPDAAYSDRLVAQSLADELRGVLPR
jgi:hypothetical protein